MRDRVFYCRGPPISDFLRISVFVVRISIRPIAHWPITRHADIARPALRVVIAGGEATRPKLLDFFPRWNLARHEKSFHKFSFTANDHAGKSLEPFSRRDFRLCVEPIDHQCKLPPGNVTLLNALE